MNDRPKKPKVMSSVAMIDRSRCGCEQLERQDRLSGARLDPMKTAPSRSPEMKPPTCGSVHSPVLLVSSAEQEGDDRGGEDGRAEVVDRAHGL